VGELFVLTALASFLGGLLWMAVDPDVLRGHFYQNRLFGLTHVFTLGWISLLAMGVLLRLAPMTLGVEPRGRKLAYTVYALWIVGGTGTAFHMATGDWFGVWTAALCLWAAAILLPVLHAGVFRRARDGNWVARYAAAAMLHLALAASVGLFIGLDKHLELVSISPYRLMAAHFHLAEVGWVTFLILGFGRKLWPLLAPVGRDSVENELRFWTLEIGLLGLVASILFAPVLEGLFAVVLGIAVTAHVVRPLLRWCRGRVPDRASAWVGAALLALVLAVLLGWAALAGIGFPSYRLYYAYGLVAILGWNTLAITGFALKLFPLWVWQQRFEPDLGRRPVPAMRSLYSSRLQALTGAGIAAGVGILAVAVLRDAPGLLRPGAWILAVGGFSFLANFLRIARWRLPRMEYRPTEDDRERFRAVYGDEGS